MVSKNSKKKFLALKKVKFFTSKKIDLEKIKVNPVKIIDDTKNKLQNYYTRIKKDWEKEQEKKIKRIKLEEKKELYRQKRLEEKEKLAKIKENQTLVGVLSPFNNEDKIKTLVKKKINVLSLELLPRITRAQSMDILSSQAN